MSQTVRERIDYKLEWQRKYRAKNIDKVREQARKYAKKRRENKEKHSEYRKYEYINNREYYKEKTRLWRLNNPIKYHAQLKRTVQIRKEYIKSFKGKEKCIWCESILKENETKVCTWCINTYPSKYVILNMKALHTYVIFKQIEEKPVKKSVILLTEAEPVKKYKGKIVSVGSEVKTLKVGNTILVPRYADEFDIEGEKYMVCKEEDICAIL